MSRRDLARQLRGIYAIVNEGSANPVSLAEAVLRAGVRIVQYRAKTGVIAGHAHALRALTRQYGSLFLLNDDWRAAESYDADGVHLGPDDVTRDELPTVRATLGEKLIGISCGSVDELRVFETALLDYVGTGSVFATSSKTDAGKPIGISGLQAVLVDSPLPVAAIGGITATNVAAVRESGVAMAAVISAIADAPNPEDAARELVALWNG